LDNRFIEGISLYKILLGVVLILKVTFFYSRKEFYTNSRHEDA